MSLVINPVTSYDGTSLNTFVSSFPRLVSRLVSGLYDGRRVRGEDTVIPGAAGRIPEDRVDDGRTIQIEIEIFGTGATNADQEADVETALAAMHTLFAPTRSPATLVVGVAAGTKSISARPLPTRLEQRFPVYAKLNIELEAVEAGWA